MENFLLILFLSFTILSSKVYAQQNYSGNSVMSCKGTNETGTYSSFLYSCNGEKLSCRAFLIFRSLPPYNSVSSISNLLTSDPDEIVHINNISRSEILDQNKELIVPVNCSCSGQYYQAVTSYVIPSKYDTYFTIANNTYQGLSTCNALVHENVYNAMDLIPGLNLHVPLRCACPTKDQTRNGVKYLLTHLVTWGENISTISAQFSISSQSTAYANGFSENSVLYPFTTILIPLTEKPSSSQTRTINIAQTQIIYPSKNKISYKSIFIGVGAGVSLAVLCFILFIVLKHKKEKKSGEVVLGKGREGKQKWNLTEHILERIVGVDQMIKVFEFEELVAATENFSPRKRLSNYVYKGFIRGKLSAIKEMRTDISKEVKFYSKINHFNLISLTGVCKHNQLSYLVFEFMENGSLKEWLCKDDNPEAESWNFRIRIALDIADGLDYIHNFTDPAYVHNNISSNSILLNRDLRAKIANFSLARSADNEKSSSSIKCVKGRNGYLAPEYLEAGQVTPKIDIYAFGIVLLEIITGKGAVFEQDGKEVLLSETVLGIMDEESNIQEFADSRLQVKHPLGYIIEQTDLVLRLVKLCAACLKTEPEGRPTAAEIISTLMKIQSDVQN
ncbi:protein LYK5-like [Nicotiana tabacum]|uniref:Protein LYK5-like n=1 Tax=Nicotiana tabacum TaxID=4097 RepID=A0A1S3ZM05_TOBAC|nr:protein LYK5-like [Nicotiana tomentosiformis]XP_016465329.1 PREDICTED: protein LYK5-like [Nicotiana tabacum]